MPWGDAWLGRVARHGMADPGSAGQGCARCDRADPGWARLCDAVGQILARLGRAAHRDSVDPSTAGQGYATQQGRSRHNWVGLRDAARQI
ncbi:hypothetical protein QJS04_geneDACA019784 [Acorus gramineus]|uniref:Uncharacterized protein n=1 Tax=Acorus gramineus TaxID=55184 RepID=A0AAV9A1X0_ACOGR|nr:hypothetical protein QJS04_geneDACA019784 [Acorus gramineus]